jgi:hypothetical protein
MNALKNKLIRVVAQIENPFHPHDARAEFGEQLAKPLAELHPVEIPRGYDRDRGDVIGVLMVVVVLLSLGFNVEALKI